MAQGGREYAPVQFLIERDHVDAFARAIGADPAAGVPPTYAAVYALGATAPQLFEDAEAAIDFGRLVHAGQSFTWHSHPEVGDTVMARGRVVSDVDRRGIRIIEFETECTLGAEPLCLSQALFVVRQ